MARRAKILSQQTVPANTGWAGYMQKGQVLQLTAMTIIDFVAFNSRDFAERLDQARTKVYNMNIFLTAGQKVLTKHNNHLLTMTEDGFAGIGAHDLQFGMCGRARHRLAAEEGRLGEYLHGSDIALPDHGCAENLSWALESYGIDYADIPSPINLFQNMEIDRETGSMQRTPVRPDSPVSVAFRAEMDLLAALSACPDLAAPRGGQAVVVRVFDS